MPEPPDLNEMLLESGLILVSEQALDAVLQRIVDLAVRVTRARYGALGVLGPDGLINQFVTVGVSTQEREAIGHLPVGRGVLGVLISDPEPLRLAEVSKHPRSVGFPPNHPPMESFLGAPVKARGHIFGNIYLTEKQGAKEFGREDEQALVILATQAGVAIENARLHEEARTRERRLDAIREIAEEILAGTELDDVLRLVARRARELVGADLAAITIPADAEGQLILTVAEGAHAGAIVGATVPMEGSASGAVIQVGEPMILRDASKQEQVYQPVIQAAHVGPAMFVPLSGANRAFGTLMVSNMAGGREFNEEDMAVVETFAGQASVGFEYARARRELRRLAVMDDRERIAKELHDGVIQSLFAVGMGLQATAVATDDPELEHRVEVAVSEIDRVIRDLRNYIFGLRPGILADRQLDQALRFLAEDFEDKNGITTVVEVDTTVAAQLASQAGDVVQLAREALSNVGRHAKATTCRVSLVRRDGTALLEIDDDGQGFDPQAAGGGGGQGLRNLRDRVASMGGQISIDSVPGEGTTVRVTIQL